MLPHVTEQDIKNILPKVKYLTAFSAVWQWHKLCFKKSLPFTVGVKISCRSCCKNFRCSFKYLCKPYVLFWGWVLQNYIQQARVIWCQRQSLIRWHVDTLKLYIVHGTTGVVPGIAPINPHAAPVYYVIILFATHTQSTAKNPNSSATYAADQNIVQ